MINPAVMETGAPLQPAPPNTTYCFLVSVTGTATRLNALLVTAGGALPSIVDPGTPVQVPRTPKHVYFQVPAGAGNPVYCTWDNNTAPVVGGPGLEFEPGVIEPFENAFALLAKNAFQFIATGATNMIVSFSD